MRDVHHYKTEPTLPVSMTAVLNVPISPIPRKRNYEKRQVS